MTSTRPIQCFLIDDDPDDQEIFALALEEINSNISCVFANDGIDALEKLNDSEFTPQYIFVDLNMPRMNGKNCVRELKKIERLKSVPIFIYSTYSDSRNKSDAPVLEATDYIVKPPSISRLSDILKKIIT